jgi:hypothetical protein
MADSIGRLRNSGRDPKRRSPVNRPALSDERGQLHACATRPVGERVLRARLCRFRILGRAGTTATLALRPLEWGDGVGDRATHGSAALTGSGSASHAGLQGVARDSGCPIGTTLSAHFACSRLARVAHGSPRRRRRAVRSGCPIPKSARGACPLSRSNARIVDLRRRIRTTSRSRSRHSAEAHRCGGGITSRTNARALDTAPPAPRRRTVPPPRARPGRASRSA